MEKRTATCYHIRTFDSLHNFLHTLKTVNADQPDQAIPFAFRQIPLFLDNFARSRKFPLRPEATVEEPTMNRVFWISLLMTLGGGLLNPQVVNAQILSNGSFDKGTQGWGLSQQEAARAQFTVVDSDSPDGGQSGRIAVTINGPAHRIQLAHSFPIKRLTTGKGYALHFFARADQLTSFQVSLMNRNKPWENLGLKRPVSVEPHWKEYVFPFYARKSDQEIGKVNFFMGQAKGTVWLDGLAIEAYDPQTITPDGPKLTTATWDLQFFKTGAIARLVHKSTGQVLIEPGVDRTAYTVTLFKDGTNKTITSEQASSIQAKPLQDGSGYSFVAQHSGFIVTLRYEIDQETGLLACRSKVENKSDRAVTRITFPILNTPQMLGNDSTDDVILYPAFDGNVMDDPYHVFRKRSGLLSGAYPGPLSCQVMAYCDRTAGLYIASHDPDGYAKTFTVDAGFQIRFSIAHLASAVAGKDLIPPYPIILGPFTGEAKRGGTSWYDAAELYRKWASRQKWAKKKVRTREDTPNWLRKGALVTTYNPRQLTPPGDQSKLEAFLKDYSSRFHTQLLPNNRGFEHNGTWFGQEYLPVIPDEVTFKESAKVARTIGGQSMIMLSGYRWTIDCITPEGTHYSSQPRFDREVARWAVHDPQGNPVIGTSTKKNDYHGRKWSRMCRATDFAKKTIVDSAKYFVECGYSVIHFDQECSGAYSASVCWARDHDHPPGNGRWIHLAMADLYQKISDACRPIDPDFALSMEEPNELYLPWLNLCQERPFGITPEWPVISPATRSVPLFLYLYHENLIGWAAFYPWKSGGHPCYSLAKGFTIGQMPGLVPTRSLRRWKPDTQRPFMTLLERCMTGYQTFAHDYLVWGRMERPLTLPIPQRHFKWAPKGKESQALVVPAVSHQVWSLDDGRIGIVLVNPETKARELAVDLSPLIESERRVVGLDRKVVQVGPACRAGHGVIQDTTRGLELQPEPVCPLLDRIAIKAPVVIRQMSTQASEQTHDGPIFRVTIPALDMVLLEVPAP